MLWYMVLKLPVELFAASRISACGVCGSDVASNAEGPWFKTEHVLLRAIGLGLVPTLNNILMYFVSAACVVERLNRMKSPGKDVILNPYFAY